MDGSSLPPCCKVLLQKIRRCFYVCNTWNNATMSVPPTLCPEDFGWKQDDGFYLIIWYYGDATPRIAEIMAGNDEELGNDENENDFESDTEYDSQSESDDE